MCGPELCLLRPKGPNAKVLWLKPPCLGLLKKKTTNGASSAPDVFEEKNSWLHVACFA
jgi:hypothetical protein